MAFDEGRGTRTLRLLAVMEAATVTGAAKSMLDFCRAAGEARGAPGVPAVYVSIVTFTRGGRDPLIFDEGRGGAGAPNEFVNAARALGLRCDLVGERFRFDPRALRGLREAVRRRAPDLVLTHHVKSHFLMLLSGLRRQFPWVAYHHGYTTTDRKMLAYNRLDRWSLPAADRVVTVCEAFARELEGARGVQREKLFVQHNPISPGRRVSEEEVRELRSRLGLGAGERVVLAVGRLSREKAHADLLRAFARLAREEVGAGAQLVIVGDGPERAPLDTLAAEAGLDGRVIFAGQSGDVAPFYAAADLFVLPSHSEGSPYALLEAMAAGLPVVATAVGGVPEIVSDGESALLVPPRDEQALAAALARALSDRGLARTLAASAAEIAATRHAPETHLRSLTGLYLDVVAEARGRSAKF
ncbi:MAG: glycosyltransferase [Pyrinomonadaceae bacterium]